MHKFGNVTAALFFVLASLLFCSYAASEPQRLPYAPSPPDNPLKGLVPYAGQGRDRFPHSMEFAYLPLSDLMTGYDQFDWQPLENLLDSVARRGHHTVFRVWLEYPGRDEGIPEFLVRDGLQVRKWRTEAGLFPARQVRTPDYENPKLRTALRNFIGALGKRYDGDHRIGYITAGLLGTWGEWHDHPHRESFASKAVQRLVMDAYAAAFKKTPVLLRYPAGEDDADYAANDGRSFGYHDDSFAWATLDTGRKQDSWFYITRLQRAGTAAIDKWKTAPIGGEIRPDVWGRIFDADPAIAGAQDFGRCVDATHVTWLMDSGMFRDNVSPARRRRAIEQVRRMGYAFHVTTADLGNVDEQRKLPVRLTVRNLGAAPFYHDWKVEIGAVDAQPHLAGTWTTDFKITGLLPDSEQRIWSTSIDARALSSGSYHLVVRVRNPMPGGVPFRFANRDQDRHLDGWLTVGSFQRR